MQKIATQVFIYASVAFGITGILFILTMPAAGSGQDGTGISGELSKFLMLEVFIILPSFALSVAGKYLNGKK